MSEEIHKGLAGVVVDYTAISKVNPESNSLLYRGYPVQELADKCTFEEVASRAGVAAGGWSTGCTTLQPRYAHPA